LLDFGKLYALQHCRYEGKLAQPCNLQEEDVSSPISTQDRQTVKGSLVALMASVGKTLRSLLGEALGTIADHDFPDAWPTMCKELVSKVNTGDMAVTNGILEASAAAFKKFDGAFDDGMVAFASALY
jgi:hypothetical protein